VQIASLQEPAGSLQDQERGEKRERRDAAIPIKLDKMLELLLRWSS
jgi:hypothetical protein